MWAGMRHVPGAVTIDTTAPPSQAVKREADYYVLGHATKFLLPGAVRIASDEPDGTSLKDVAFRNPSGEVVLYMLNAGTKGQDLRVGFHGKIAVTSLPAGSVATFHMEAIAVGPVFLISLSLVARVQRVRVAPRSLELKKKLAPAASL